MNEQRGFIVADKNGTLAQQYKWLWEQQRDEFLRLQADNDAAHQQLVMVQRERDVYAAALLQAHKAAAAWEQVFASLKSANQ